MKRPLDKDGKANVYQRITSKYLETFLNPVHNDPNDAAKAASAAADKVKVNDPNTAVSAVADAAAETVASGV